MSLPTPHLALHCALPISVPVEPTRCADHRHDQPGTQSAGRLGGASMNLGLKLRLVDKTLLTDDIAMLDFASADGNDLPRWEPGAHLDMQLHSGLRRQYSLCGQLRSRDTYTVCVLRQRGGRGGSVEIHDRLDIGDEIDSSHPRNHFPLIPAADYVLLAGGI